MGKEDSLVKTLACLEKDILVLRRVIEAQSLRCSALGTAVIYKIPDKSLYCADKKQFSVIPLLFVASLLCALIIVPLANVFNANLTIGGAVAIGCVLGGVLSVVYLLLFLLGYFERQHDYEKALQEYKAKVIDECMRMYREKQERVRVFSEITDLKILLGKSESVRDRLYDELSVRREFRNSAAILTICGYFESNRCVCLDGQTGACALYSSEVAKRSVIPSLYEASVNMEVIAKAQPILHEAILSADEMLAKIEELDGDADARGRDILMNVFRTTVISDTAIAAEQLAFAT